MSCPNCGGTMIGDGVTMPIYCENAEAPNTEPDSAPVFCAKTCASCDEVPNDELITCVGCGEAICRVCYYVDGCSLCGE